jgi:hypothetical protein
MSNSTDIVAACGGELVTYLPAGGVAKTFKAIVDRRPTQPEQAGAFQYAANTLELLIPRDALNGMTAIQERKDRVRFKKSLDDAQETDFTVNKVIQEDAGLVTSDGGMFRVLVQA